MSTTETDVQIVPARAQKRIDWPEGLVSLPIQFGVMASDLGFSPSDRQRIAEGADAGDQKDVAVVNLTINLVLELMARDVETRPVRDQRGKRLYLDENGRLTVLPTSPVLANDDGSPLEHAPAVERRSRWAIRSGAETLTAPGAPIPKPGYWKEHVLANATDLFRRLNFLSPTVETTHLHERDNPERYRAIHAHAISDKAPLRKALLSWLPGFIANPVSTWDGER